MNWSQLWLNYKTRNDDFWKAYFRCIVCGEDSNILRSAVAELKNFGEKAYSVNVQVQSEADKETPCIVLKKVTDSALYQEGYKIVAGERHLEIEANSDCGILYGVFGLIRTIMQDEETFKGPQIQIPECRYRMLDHWDNMDGSIERGYSGKSFFFKDGQVLTGERIRDYARLTASIGINQVAINNVNVKGNAAYLITDQYLSEISKIADILGDYGIKLYLSVDFSAPLGIGKKETADPMSNEVKAWWAGCVKHIYDKIPDFGGFLVKADSEGRPGPFHYGRTHGDGANMLAEALKPYGGYVIWRCFVYNCRQDWRDNKSDRAKAAYETFMPVDGTFDDHVILQIKNGPMDFQVREPVSPLFGGMQRTNQMLEVQMAQEYTGHQIDVCYLVPMWKEVLSFRTYCKDTDDTVADIINGKTFGNAACGMAAVANTGDDENWTGHDLAAANFYGFGRLAWNTELTAAEIAKEWIRCTFGSKEPVISAVKTILMKSWPAYEKYTTPYGIGWMVTPHTHYGPSVEGYEYDVWGTYHKANREAIGIDRTSRGTGYSLQYYGENASRYETMETCPEELLLFFHRVSYDTKLKNQKTLLQNIYNCHFEGVEEVEEMIQLWKSLKPYLPEAVYDRGAERFERQYSNSKNWRDIVNTYFYRKTLIGDDQQRVIYE